MNNIICLKWGEKYGPEYVNNLYSGVKRNLSLPFRFFCFTDDPSGIRSEVNVRPLLDNELRGWWGKVAFFKSPMADVKGIVLSFDLDIVIIDNIDCFFDLDGDFCIQKDNNKRNGNNTSIMRFEANKHSDIYDNFNKNDIFKTRYWGDQVWVTEKRPNAVNWPEGWARSYKWDCFGNVGTGLMNARGLGNFSIPKGCKIIIFHGNPMPHERLNDIGNFWKEI
jgi:hypothetical protein